MGELANRGESAIVPEVFYKQVSSILNAARDKAYTAVNFAMVEAYWEIGKSIVDEQGGEERAAYGEALIAGLSRRLTADFGRGFGIANLRNMRQFFLAFPIRDALRSELSWTHYRMLMRVENENARQFYIEEAIKSNWSTRQLERQINSFFYERLLSSQNKEKVSEEIQKLEPAKVPEDIIRDPYVLEFLYLPSEEELSQELQREYRALEDSKCSSPLCDENPSAM